jgi:hypothetical protein
VIVPTKYYSTPTEVFRRAGISAVIWANPLIRAAASAMQSVAAQIQREQSIAEVEDRLTIQRVEEQFYQGLHPWWFLSEKKLSAFCESHQLELVYFWNVPQDVVLLDGKEIMLKGFFLKNKKI